LILILIYTVLKSNLLLSMLKLLMSFSMFVINYTTIVVNTNIVDDLLDDTMMLLFLVLSQF